ncbi:MAG: hydroxyisourate hydrolase [Bryobacterales bacterium]|nr:hydroxyisourate hydrolase [Bryobacterales bacterium]
MARISTHVLDMVSGRPAAGVRIELYQLGCERLLVGSAETNADGRTDQPLLSGDAIPASVYDLIFHMADYFGPVGTLSFLDEIVIRFGVSDVRGNYHVPLLVAPHGYTTYKGS